MKMIKFTTNKGNALYLKADIINSLSLGVPDKDTLETTLILYNGGYSTVKGSPEYIFDEINKVLSTELTIVPEEP